MHIYCLIFMKFLQKIHPINISLHSDYLKRGTFQKIYFLTFKKAFFQFVRPGTLNHSICPPRVSKEGSKWNLWVLKNSERWRNVYVHSDIIIYWFNQIRWFALTCCFEVITSKCQFRHTLIWPNNWRTLYFHDFELMANST